MKFCYRSVWYSRTPSVIETEEGEIIGKYRGAILRSRSPQSVPSQEHCLRGRYRGVDVNLRF